MLKMHFLFGSFISTVRSPLSFSSYLRLGISIALVQWMYVEIFCRTCEDLDCENDIQWVSSRSAGVQLR